jgi:hypothetical protein
MFVLSLSLTAPMVSLATSSTPLADHQALGIAPTVQKVKHRRMSFTKTYPKPVHHHEVHMHNGKVIIMKLVETKTGKVLFHGMPYGLDAVQKAGKAAKKTRYTPANYKKFMEVHLKKLKQAKNTKTQIAYSPVKTSIPLKSPRMTAMATTASYPTDCSTNSSTAGYTCGISAAADTTTGWISGSECYNFNSTKMSGFNTSSDFSSINSSSSTAGQMNASTSISGRYGLLSAEADLSLSDQWDSSANSKDMNFNFINVFQIANTLDPSYPLSRYGRNAVATNSFSGVCGNRFVTNQWVGILITGHLSINAQTTASLATMNTNLKASYGLSSITTAVSTAKSDTSGSSEISFTLKMIGGGTAAQSYISDAAGSSYLPACVSSFDTVACANFLTVLNYQAAQANKSFMNETVTSTGLDLSNVQTFADGVNGTATPIVKPNTSAGLGYLTVIDPSAIISDATNAANNTTSFSLTTNSALINYKDPITHYLQIVNQISTLQKRADKLNTALATNAGYDPNLEMDSLIDLTTNLVAVYKKDKKAMYDNLTACFLTGTATTALIDCAPILNLTTTYNPALSSDILTAWDWYTNSYNTLVSGLSSSTTPTSVTKNAIFLQSALQNSLALQYSSRFSAKNPLGSPYASQQFSYPNDVLWVTNLPSIWRCETQDPYVCSTFETANIYSTPNPAGKPALITFNDFNWPGLYTQGGWIKSWINLIPLDSPTGNMFSLVEDASPYRYTIYDLGFSQSYELPPTGATLTVSPSYCVQNFDSPCGYYQASTSLDNNKSFKISNEISVIPSFFE